MNEGAASNAIDERRVTLFNSRDDIEQVQKDLLTTVERRGFDAASTFAIRISLEEALSNAFKHGNKDDTNKTVTLIWQVKPDAVEIEVCDQGEGFDPRAVPNPTEQENIEIPSGRGLLLIRSFMSDVQIVPPGNRLRMRFEKTG